MKFKSLRTEEEASSPTTVIIYAMLY